MSKESANQIVVARFIGRIVVAGNDKSLNYKSRTLGTEALSVQLRKSYFNSTLGKI